MCSADESWKVGKLCEEREIFQMVMKYFTAETNW
ncbi:Uncharacterised protein [Corynebacterium ulcerans]|nr:hypothetical protein D881_02815 [Corynebacterium ulcerans NCTC 12077]STC78426.1 Uncharacterised protein [Corynebacterium ulcerans]